MTTPEMTTPEMTAPDTAPETTPEVTAPDTAPDTGPAMVHIADAAKAVTLRASIERIGRKAEIMKLDTQRGTAARQDAEEIRLLARIALRCIGGENA
jgi:hypothetical protein